MGYFSDNYMIHVEGASNAVESIREAIKNFAPDCDMEQKGNVIHVCDTYRIMNIEQTCDFMALLARAAMGATFTMDGSTEYSVGGGVMYFAAELQNGELNFRHSDWCETYLSEELEEIETFEDFCEEYGDVLASEDDFRRAKENEVTYYVDGEIYVDIPLGKVIHIEY